MTREGRQRSIGQHDSKTIILCHCEPVRRLVWQSVAFWADRVVRPYKHVTGGAVRRDDVGIVPYGVQGAMAERHPCFATPAGGGEIYVSRHKKRERRRAFSFCIFSKRSQHSLAPAGMESSSSSRCSFSSPFSLCTAEMSMPQEGMPIIFRVGRFKMATAVLPTSSSGS